MKIKKKKKVPSIKTAVRVRKVSDMLLAFLAEQVRQSLDPRIALVTLTGIEMTPDLKRAKVFWMVPAETLGASMPDGDREAGDSSANVRLMFPGEQQVDFVQSGLSDLVGLFRRNIARELDLRYVPELFFHYDRTFERASKIDTILDNLNAERQIEVEHEGD